MKEKRAKYLWSENPYSEILEITKTSKLEIEEVYEVLKDAVYLPNLNKIQNIILDCFDSQNKKVYGFYQNKILIGILIAEYKNKIEIKYLAVHEYFRKEGIGSQLIDFIKKKKKEIIFLFTDSDSVGFYRLNSFHCIERFVKNNNEEYLRYYCVLENN
jgi:ribosomal protein S18 acetylase RimI-like enzyme